MKKLWLLLLPILLVGCATKVEIESTTKYKCGTEMVKAEILEDDSAVIYVNGKSHVLDHMVAADGAKYTNRDGNVTFWSKGDKASLEMFGKTYPKCVEVVK